jgi:ABC-type molybdenum transport system ATPase subunit/photorepair protein PhrA
VERLSAAMARPIPPQKREIMYSVISPYVGSIEAQLQALEEIHDVITMFVAHLKEFLGPSKSVSYEVRRGFTITSNVGSRLDLGMLSSGEKHLLFLLCNTLVARDKASILIIDEPEISPNIKWQRRLIQALRDCVAGATVQLIFASHSIELLAQHKSYVVRLENQEAPSTNGEKDRTPRRRRAQDDSRVDSEV